MGGFIGSMDDITTLAKLAAVSIDEVSAAAGRATVKAAGVVDEYGGNAAVFPRGNCGA